MKQTQKKIVWLVAFLGVGSIQVFGKPFAEGPYLGQTPPGPIAQVFAPGLICNTGPHQWESHGSFSADGNTFCFYRLGYVYITGNTDQGWTAPKRIQSIPYQAFSPCLTPDADSIYFMGRDERSKAYHPFRCQRTSDGWSLPQELEPFLSYPGLSHGGFSFAADNSIYVFTTWQKEGGRERGTFYAPYVNDAWARAIKLSVDAGAPGIAPDTSFMVFNANKAMRGGGLGATDLYLILRQPDGTWSEPRNLGRRVNSAYFEYGAQISPDKKYLFFTRANGWSENSSRDTADIYWVELKEYLPESYR